jgi:hypothetical protein
MTRALADVTEGALDTTYTVLHRSTRRSTRKLLRSFKYGIGPKARQSGRATLFLSSLRTMWRIYDRGCARRLSRRRIACVVAERYYLNRGSACLQLFHVSGAGSSSRSIISDICASVGNRHGSHGSVTMVEAICCIKLGESSSEISGILDDNSSLTRAVVLEALALFNKDPMPSVARGFSL